MTERTNEIYCSVAAKRLDCDNTVHVYTILYHTIRCNKKRYIKMSDKVQLYLKRQIKCY